MALGGECQGSMFRQADARVPKSAPQEAAGTILSMALK
jgi:hypothetical protein